MIKLVVIVVALLSLSGCTSTRYVGAFPVKTHRDSLDYSEVSRLISGRDITVFMRDGKIFPATGIRVTTDSVGFYKRTNQVELAVGTADVAGIEVTNYLSAVFMGSLLGTVGGVTAGFATGQLLTAGHSSDADMAVGIAGLFGGLVGMVGGTVYGGIHGNVRIYEFIHSAELVKKSQQLKK